MRGLQRSAGNAAVARLLGARRRTLARDPEYPPGKEPSSGYWDNLTPAELGRRVADDLLADAKYAGLAPGILNGGWIKLMVDTVEAIRVKGRLDLLRFVAAGTPRVKLVAEMVHDPAGLDITALLGTLPGGVPDDQVKEVEARRIDLAMSQFATDRAAPAAEVTKATDDAARKGKLDALRAFDSKRLPALEKLTATRGAERWKHEDPAAQDAVLAAIELRSAYDALSDLDKTNADVAKRAREGHGAEENWCGFFATDQYVASNFDSKALLGSFDSTFRVWAFFTYQYGAITGRFPKYVHKEDGSWEEVAKYHEQRGSKRKWIPTKDMGKDGLDIRSGDILTLSVAINDNTEKEYGDHIVMVLSYDPTSGRLFTIGGNDGGYVVRNGDPPAKESTDDKATREAREAATGKQLQKPTAGGGHVGVGIQELKHQPKPEAAGAKVLHTHVAAIGRPSIADFERHEYRDKLPAAPKK